MVYIMKTKLNYIKITLLILVLSTSLLGCSQAKPTGLMVSETVQLIPSIATKTITQTPTEEISVTPTIKPSLTISPTPTPSFTPIPTLSKSEARQKISSLVRDNGGCYLPCWWGITPGKTSLFEAYQYLKSLNVGIAKPNNSSQAFGYNFSESLEGGGLIVNEDQKITLLVIDPNASKHSFQLHQIISNYGKPDNIFIKTDTCTLDNIPPFVLVLLYSNKHFLVIYDFNAKIISGSVSGCPRGIAPKVYIWSSDQIVSEKEIEYWALGGDPSTKLRPLNIATDLTIDTFYQMFIDQNKLNCIQTPIDIW